MSVPLQYFTEKEINAVSFGTDDGFNNCAIQSLLSLDSLRRNLGRPLTLTCAYRTVEWDMEHGRSGKSDHCRGTGFDIKIDGLKDAIEIVAQASKEGFNAFGINLESGFVHIGQRHGKLTTWEY